MFASFLDKIEIWQCYVRREVSRSEFLGPLPESHGENTDSRSTYNVDVTQENEQRFRTSKKVLQMRPADVAQAYSGGFREGKGRGSLICFDGFNPCSLPSEVWTIGDAYSLSPLLCAPFLCEQFPSAAPPSQGGNGMCPFSARHSDFITDLPVFQSKGCQL